MGICASADALPAETAADKKIENANKEAEQQDGKISKLLLLGAGSSGKSTLFKQMITIYGKGFPENERKTYTSIIHNNIITAMKMLVKNVSKYGSISPSLSESKRIMESDMKEDQPLTEDLAVHISSLWRDPGIQSAFEHQAEFQLTDSAKYFFERIDIISKFGYIPAEQDVLRSRAPTTGIVETRFALNGHNFAMYDVGGQRNERKKWIHCFENVTAVLFVAAISEYNQVLYEDETQNRMVESLTLFDEICNSKWFRRTSMILFLNKRDIFSDKLTKFPLSDFFKEYSGPNEFEESADWIRQQFIEKNQEQDKTVYTHITTATDTTNIQVVFSAVTDIIIRTNLNKVGLI